MTVTVSFCNLFMYSLIQSGLPQSGRQKAQGSYFCILVQTREQQEKCPRSIRGCWSFLQLYRATGTHQLLSKPGGTLIHTLPAWHTKVQISSQVRAHPKQVPELTMYMLSLKTAAPRSWSRFYCTWEHPATALSFHLEVDGVTQTTHPKGMPL